ncbi:semaphorin-1A-like [Cryptotermes secundus]|uniref:semaphorin-1A-like n=1 Tax=Cryptotermes secundus TaxID=105785 RepID=UPI001454C842|nr:semaphorin-1A-like [Cryptotermes secundus]
MIAGKIIGKDAGSVGGLSSTYPKTFNQDSGHAGKDVPDGEVINIMQDEEEHNGPEVSAADSPAPKYSVETLAMAVVAGSVAALMVGFVTGYFCGRKCHKEEEDNLPYPDTEYEYFEQRQTVNSRLAPEPKLLPQEEVTYAEPVLVPAPGPNKLNSPKSTLRKAHNANHAAETLFQFADNYTPPPRDPYAHQRGRDNFGTLRSHQGDGYRSGRAPPGSGIVSDGFGTARSAKKVYL